MKFQSKYFPFIIFSMVYLTVCAVIYYLIDSPFYGSDINLVNRGIDSPLRLWLNGYLGVFFGFRFLGTLNWLVIPLVICYLITEKNYSRWVSALFLLYAVSIAIIISQGYFNMRYQITLLPLTVSMVIYFSWIYSERSTWRNGKYFLPVLFFMVTIFNDYKYFANPDKKNVPVQSKTTANTKNYSNWLKPLSPQLLDFIRQMPVNMDSKMLVNNVPFYFYYTDLPGVYYWCQDDIYYDACGPKQLMKLYQDKALSDYLLKELRCRYILTIALYDGYSQMFDQYVTQYCNPVYSDSNGYRIFEIKN